MANDRPSTRAKILVVEDESLIALDLAQMIEDAGYETLGPAPTVEKALAIIDKDLPDAALLDENLHGKRVTPVADILARNNVPFIVISGHARDISGDASLSNARRLEKPVVPKRLSAAIAKMLER